MALKFLDTIHMLIPAKAALLVATVLFPSAAFWQDAAAASPDYTHAAVDATFVQFYPTLLPIAASKRTLSAAYQKEIGTASQKQN